jgi:thymidylate synthase (FAD)
MENSIPVLDHGFIRLDGVCADDLSVVNSAKVSFAKYQSEMDDSCSGLIQYLMKNRHGSPFEHNMFRFHVKCPIFVAREWFRHRIGSFNEWSGRYAKLEPDFYVPDREQIRTQVGKPGAYTFETVEDDDIALMASTFLEEFQKKSFDVYSTMLEQGIAKEVARIVLPVGTYTQFYWTINARSLMNFLSLRNHKDAQWEIRQYAQKIEKFFEEHMPITYQSFIKGERVAP